MKPMKIKHTFKNGKTIPCLYKTYDGFNCYDVKVGGTGLKDGDAGHGAVHYFSVESNAVNSFVARETHEGFEVVMLGDEEVLKCIEMLDFVSHELKKLVYKN